MTARPAQRVEMVPVDRISVLNPRVRNPRVFKEIIDSISTVGLKRPITVTRRAEADGPFYDLVCGQGRLEAFRELGETEIPALVVNADMEDCLVASLVENCARRHHRSLDLLQDIGGMKQRGHTVADIARQTGLSGEFVGGVLRLLEKGEQRLLQAVEAGQMPISVAIEIADADEPGVQLALQHAYENNLLRGRKLLAAKRLVEQRKKRGKHVLSFRTDGAAVSSASLLNAYREETDRKRLLVRRAEIAKSRLTFVTNALRKLFADRAMMEILESEGLRDMPQELCEHLSGAGGHMS
ncbi:chromosome partitioning protein ParB [Neoasaia chiangmaiensis NBRC 101099]|uniref:Chromosome partitioning protein ParB n=1 Tax=Neoasaia chiangmaiensis TaxID=320497 RepID=A0A1U9KTU8_9PROT|nr:plasmid partitioning protein RepB C-terminal domain-containing protein [Neoasaia chiangmaiensis]AQS89147.1 chromosome partitioning protein ParB [Neoasaia chiangmaiensis]GBR37122.1 chromosome partitioning protein ParB [Neoasaia chiangmaiensis NBRC 101099]GEN16499.1 chromosome partitioning protein ParB [Neoasaia chiangmaiensis]